MTRAPYDEYKDSNIGWLGPVPSHWKVTPLFAIASERSEKNLGMQEDNLLSLSYGNIVEKNIATLDGLLPASFETYQIVYPDDIVMRLTDLQNDKRSLRSAIVKAKGIITSAYLALNPRTVNPAFLSYLLRAYDLTKVFYSMGGGLRQSMKFADVKRLPILLPEPVEQVLITKFLDRETSKIDDLVAEQERLIALLKEKRQAVISHAVTKGLNPDVPMKDSGIRFLGTIPEHWSVLPLKYVASVGNGSTPLKDNLTYWQSGTFPWLNSSVVNSENVTQPSGYVSELALKECHLPVIEPPAVLVGLTGQGKTRGQCAMLSIQATINQHLAYIKPKSSDISCEYLKLVLESLRILIRMESEGAGSTKGAITCEQLKSQLVPLPPFGEQKKICRDVQSKLTGIDRVVSETENSLELLQERRSALISAAVTGKIDVRGLVSSEEAA
jgi:type I restriction enzyme S subunit